MANETVGEETIRGENVERAVKGFVNIKLKFKQLFKVQNSNKWTETYYREDGAPLSGAGTRDLGNVARLTQFPFIEPNWTKVQGQHVKYAGKSKISYEDILTDAIAIQERTLFKVAQAIAKAWDINAYTALSETTGINTFAIAAGFEWDNSTLANRDPIGDIIKAIRYCSDDDYDVKENGYLLLNGYDMEQLLKNTKVINNPSFKTADVVSNGKVGQIVGLTIIESNNVPQDEAIVMKGGLQAWKEVIGMSSDIIVDRGVSTVIKAWTIGQFQITDVGAICRITNTKA